MKKKQFKLGVLPLILALLFTLNTCKGQQDDNTADSTNIMGLPPLKEQFSEYFMMGNIFNPGDATSASGINNQKLTRHFNVLTAENDMKPDKIAPNQGSYTFTTADRMVNAARASGFQVVGHTLLWHSQNANWMTSTNCTLENMKTYITAVVTHFKGKIYSWDVLNEVFPNPDDGNGFTTTSNWKNVMRSDNPWFAKQSSDFVYEGFLAARLADPGAILYYNDFNMTAEAKRTMVHNMVSDVNQRYLDGSDKPEGEDSDRLLIEGIGMQSHHRGGEGTGTSSTQAANVEAALELFKPLGVKISISELDVIARVNFDDVSQGGPNLSALSGNNLEAQATKYGEFAAVFLKYADIIERVTFWGVTDPESWRSAAQPLLFDKDGEAKPAYYSFVGALEQ